MFLLGTGIGIVAFAETEPFFADFWNNAGFLGRLTIPEWAGVSNGVVVLGVIAMALGAFKFAEWAEGRFSKGES